jgi:hypothetical protein
MPKPPHLSEGLLGGQGHGGVMLIRELVSPRLLFDEPSPVK